MNHGAQSRLRELAVLAGLLILINAPLLLTGQPWSGFVFRPAAVAAGEWWRILLHPFVHVTWYHLLLDAGAFLLLYHQLEERTARGRTFLTACCAAGSLLVSLALAPAVYEQGLCGLSGTAHGLMAIAGLELIARKPAARENVIAGAACLAVVIGKSAIEAVTGSVVFAGLHAGLVGRPIAVCHAGGVIAGFAAWLALRAAAAEGRQTRASTPPGNQRVPGSEPLVT